MSHSWPLPPSPCSLSPLLHSPSPKHRDHPRVGLETQGKDRETQPASVSACPTRVPGCVSWPLPPLAPKLTLKIVLTLQSARLLCTLGCVPPGLFPCHRQPSPPPRPSLPPVSPSCRPEANPTAPSVSSRIPDLGTPTPKLRFLIKEAQRVLTAPPQLLPDAASSILFMFLLLFVFSFFHFPFLIFPKK